MGGFAGLAPDNSKSYIRFSVLFGIWNNGIPDKPLPIAEIVVTLHRHRIKVEGSNRKQFNGLSPVRDSIALFNVGEEEKFYCAHNKTSAHMFLLKSWQKIL